jgi:hypothetical protein
MSFPDVSLPNPAEFVRSFRRHFVNFHVLWQKTGVPPGVRHTTPTETPLRDADLPADLHPLLAEFHKTHPNSQIVWERHMSVVDGKVVNVIEDERELPSDNAIVTVSRTLSLNAEDTARVVTDLFVGRSK